MEVIVALGLALGAYHVYDHVTTQEEVVAYEKPQVEVVKTLPSVGIHRYDYKKPTTATNVTWVFTN